MDDQTNDKEGILYSALELYNERYFDNMRNSYLVVLARAIKMNEIKHPERITEYADYLLGVIFSLSVLQKVKTREELKAHIDDQLSLLT